MKLSELTEPRRSQKFLNLPYSCLLILMSLKVASDNLQGKLLEMMQQKLVLIKEYDENKHKLGVEQIETICEVGQGEHMSLVTDLMGDPLCRIRQFPLHMMLVSGNY